MNREILRLALPNILSNLSVPLLSTVDTALMGQVSPLHLGAVGIGAMLFNVFYWNFVFLRMGTTGITAQAFGREDQEEMIATLGRSLTIAIAIGITIIALHPWLGKAGFVVMNIAADQQPLVSGYFNTRVWAVPATLCLYAVFGWFFGMQNAFFPLYITLFLNFLNIMLNFFFVRGLGMGVEGVALATVIAQYAGLALAGILFYYRYKTMLAAFRKNLLFYTGSLARFLLINRDIFLRTLLLTFVYTFFYSQAAAFGALTLAANVLLLQLVFWISYGIDGFAYAAESLVGKYTGSGQAGQQQTAIRLSFRWGVAVALVYSLGFYLMRDSIPKIFSQDASLLELTASYYFWVLVIPLAASFSFIWDGILVGLTASVTMRNSMLAAVIAFLLTFFTFESTFGNHALWLSLTLFLLCRGAAIAGLARWKGGVVFLK